MLLFLLAKLRSLGSLIESIPYATSLIDKLKSSAKWAASYTPAVVTSAIGLMIALVIVFNTVGMHKRWMRWYAGSKVVMVAVFDSSGRPLGGGTGFYVQAPSGHTYVITNAHVCEGLPHPNGMLTIQMPDGTLMPRRILEVSDKTDLCLMEAPPNVKGLKLAGDEADVGDTVYAVGHPRLIPLTISQGDVVGTEFHDVGLGVIGEEIQEKDCHKPKNTIITVGNIFGSIDICAEHINSTQTTIVSLPGSSGSPIINSSGHLVGVLFAGDDEVHWTVYITLHDVKDFIKPY